MLWFLTADDLSNTRTNSTHSVSTVMDFRKSHRRVSFMLRNTRRYLDPLIAITPTYTEIACVNARVGIGFNLCNSNLLMRNIYHARCCRSIAKIFSYGSITIEVLLDGTSDDIISTNYVITGGFGYNRTVVYTFCSNVHGSNQTIYGGEYRFAVFSLTGDEIHSLQITPSFFASQGCARS